MYKRQNIACRKEVMYYARYVDDIFIILTSLPVGTSIDQYYADMTRLRHEVIESIRHRSVGEPGCRRFGLSLIHISDWLYNTDCMLFLLGLFLYRLFRQSLVSAAVSVYCTDVKGERFSG